MTASTKTASTTDIGAHVPGRVPNAKNVPPARTAPPNSSHLNLDHGFADANNTKPSVNAVWPAATGTSFGLNIA